MSWGEVFPELGEPVLGEPVEYAAVASRAAEVAISAGGSSVGSADVLQGSTADAVGAMLDELQGSLKELPPVFESVSAVFAAHRDRLESLRIEAAVALALAEVRWDALRSAATALGEARAALASIERELPPADTHELERRRWAALGRVARAESAYDEAMAALDASRVNHQELSEAEASLVLMTCAALGGIALGDLRDPSGWRSALGKLGDIAGVAFDWTVGAAIDIVDGVIDASAALADGRFTDALHHLNDALDGAVRLLTSVTIAVAAVGVFACPAALVALPGLMTLGQGLSAAEVVVGGALLATQAPHPETGATVGVVELVGAGVGALGSGRLGAGSGLAGTARAERAVLAAAGAGPYAPRVFLRSEADNAAILALGSAPLVNASTGRAVTGAARRRIVRRARVESAGYSIRADLTAAVDDVVVDNVTERAAEHAARAGLGAVHPDAEGSLNRVGFDGLREQLLALREFRFGRVAGGAVVHLAGA